MLRPISKGVTMRKPVLYGFPRAVYARNAFSLLTN